MLDPNPLDYRFSPSVAHSAGLLLPAASDVAEGSPRPDLARPAVQEMREACELPDDLLGGNRRMRAKCARWLPKEAEEKTENYAIRVARSTVFPFYRDTLQDLAARPFGRELTFEQAPPARFDEFLRDVDGSGKALTVLARDVLLQAMHRGMHHVLVDASSTSGTNAETTEGRRVYARQIDALSLLDVTDEADAEGRRRVTYCRFVVSVDRKVKRFEHVAEPQIVELTKPLGDKPGTKVTWSFDTTSRKWVAAAPVDYNPGRFGIPLFTMYTEQTGHYRAQPVLEDLAWVNLAHFQSRSDHAHVMRIARLITLVTLGFPASSKTGPLADKVHDQIVLGPLSRINSPRPPNEVSVSFLEPSGKSIELSFHDMEQLADECKRLGARHLTSKTGNVTARAVSLDDAKSVNNLQTWCLRLEVFLRQVLEATAEWLNLGELPAQAQPRVHKEFQAAGNTEAGARALRDITPALSKRQLLVEAVRYGILRPDFPVDENLAELEREQAAIDAAVAAAAGTPGGPDPGHQDDDEDEDGDEDGDEGAAA